MNTTELIDIIARSAGVDMSAVSLSMLQVDDVAGRWCVTATFSAQSNEIVNILNHITSGTFSTNMQFGLTNSGIFAGTVLGDSCGRATQSASFQMCNIAFLNEDYPEYDPENLVALQKVVADAFGVPQDLVAVTALYIGNTNHCNLIDATFSNIAYFSFFFFYNPVTMTPLFFGNNLDLQ